MITEITPQLWLGDSQDAAYGDLASLGIDAMLNCASDLAELRYWGDGVHAAHCGLVDGPGNSLAAYYSAVLQLMHLVGAGKRILVHCHKGESRSVAVLIMYLHAVGRLGWDHYRKMIAEAVVKAHAGEPDAPTEMPEPHLAHKSAFNRMDWRFLAGVI